MKNIKSISFMAILALAIILTISCSGDGGGNGTEPIKKAKISGLSQKGPFVEGSKAILHELNSSFAKTGRSFTEIIADDKGSFEIKGVELVSPYAVLEANGQYRNEVTGKVTSGSISLFAIADLRERNNVNVNILTHLEYYRVLNLVENGGKTITAAKKQAQREILAVFGIDGSNFASSEDMSIFGTSEGDAALLAISVLLQGDLNEGEFVQRLTKFSKSIEENGAWNNYEEKNRMAEWASGASFGSIKNAILGWGLSAKVPEFGKYVNDYVYASYGLGECNAEGWGNVDGNFVCRNGVWKMAKYGDAFCSANKVCSILTDVRDGKEYIAVPIGEQIWMAENLNYEAEGSKCYDNDPANCQKYGRLYEWATAKKACPEGWHLPSNEEWGELRYIDGISDTDSTYAGEMAGKILKAKVGWNNDGNGIDVYGFAALPGGGTFAYSGGKTFSGGFNAVGNEGTWWTASDEDRSAFCWYMHYNREFLNNSSADKSIVFSVRCLQD